MSLSTKVSYTIIYSILVLHIYSILIYLFISIIPSKEVFCLFAVRLQDTDDGCGRVRADWASEPERGFPL